MDEPKAVPERIARPEPQEIPRDLIAAWTHLPQDMVPEIGITRATLDHLFFAIHHQSWAHATLAEAVARTTKGDMEGAAVFFDNSLAYGQRSLNNLNEFMTSIMRATLTPPEVSE